MRRIDGEAFQMNINGRILIERNNFSNISYLAFSGMQNKLSSYLAITEFKFFFLQILFQRFVLEIVTNVQMFKKWIFYFNQILFIQQIFQSD